MQTIKQTHTRWAANPASCFGLEMVERTIQFVDLPDALAETLADMGAKWISEMEHVEYDLPD